MANTYTQLYYHVIIVVKGRRNLIQSEWKDRLYRYMTGISTNKKQKLMIVNGMPDHLHLLIGSNPDCNLSHIMRDIKANSSRFINENGWLKNQFEWQIGFAAFTVGYSQVKTVINYIVNQEKHHRKKSFKKEYEEFLKDNGVDYNTAYIFEEVK